MSGGIAQLIDLIPGNIGKLTALVGLMMAVMVLRSQFKKDDLANLELKEKELVLQKNELEIAILKKGLKDAAE